MGRKRRYDLRDFWPWYERQWHTRGGTATRPPFGLGDLHEDEPLPKWQRRIAQILSIAIGALLVASVVWGLLR